MSSLRVNEIFFSIQGESTRAGMPCVFIRLAGCHLRCTYCDTEYAFREGDTRQIAEVAAAALAYPCTLVEITGGEPLLQTRVHDLIDLLLQRGRTVLIETSGACDIDAGGLCDPRVIRIMDLKTPASGEADRNDLGNLERLRPLDEVKFVICDRADYDWARDLIRSHDLTRRTAAVLMSPAFHQPRGIEIAGHAGLDPRRLAEWILEDGLDVRMQLQLHKFIWDPLTRGV